MTGFLDELTSRLEHMVGEVQKLPQEVLPSVQAHWSNPKSFRGMWQHLAAMPLCSADLARGVDAFGDMPVVVLSAGARAARLLPAMLGFSPDPSTGITSDYATGVAFESRNLPKDSVVAELRRSFEFLKQSLGNATPSSMTAPVTMFGQPFTGQSAWILTVTHLHEHLGQLIAYARTNGVKPPWS